MKNMIQAKAKAMQALEEAIDAAEAMMEFARDDKWSVGEHEICSDADDDLRKIRDRLQRVPARPKQF